MTVSADLIDLWGGLKHLIGLLRLLTQLQLTDTAVSRSLSHSLLLCISSKMAKTKTRGFAAG